MQKSVLFTLSLLMTIIFCSNSFAALTNSKKYCLKKKWSSCYLFAEEQRKNNAPFSQYKDYIIEACNHDSTISCMLLLEIYEEKNDTKNAIYYGEKACDTGWGCFHLYLLLKKSKAPKEDIIDAARRSCETSINRDNILSTCDDYRDELYKNGFKKEARELAISQCNRFFEVNLFDQWLKYHQQLQLLNKSLPLNHGKLCDTYLGMHQITNTIESCDDYILWEYEKGNKDYALDFALSLCDQGDFITCQQAAVIADSMGKKELANSLDQLACSKNAEQFIVSCARIKRRMI